MKIFLKVKPKSSQEKVEKVSNNVFIVWVKEPPEQGRANEAVVKVLSDYFSISKSNIRILSGHTSKSKIVEVIGLNPQDIDKIN